MQSLDSSEGLLLSQPNGNVMHGDFTGFSHGAFNSNLYAGGAVRDRLSPAGPTLNTSRGNQTPQHSHTIDMQTPATAYDMNFTPLLPSQLLMGSPFQPGSPSTFQSPQFPGFSAFTPQHNGTNAQSQPTQGDSPLQAHQTLAPQMMPSFGPTGYMGATQYYGGPQPGAGAFMTYGNNFGAPANMMLTVPNSTSRVVYLGNIPPDTSVEELLNHVRSGPIESIRLLMDKNCAFLSFLDANSAVQFHSDAMLKKLQIRGQEIKVGWGKPSPVPSIVASAVQQSGASRNVYLGNLPSDITEEEIREDLGKFGPIDMVKLVREKSIGFVHFLTISSAIKAVNQLPQEQKWQAPRRVFYGKDRCAYVSKTQQQNAAQFLGISPEYAHVLNSSDREMLHQSITQQSVAAAAVATAAGGATNMGNRTVYLGNIHPETSTEEICNVVRGGLLHHIRYIPDKHICFVTFIDPTSAASFFSLSNMQGLMIHNRRLKIGWGKHSGPIPPAIALAVSAGASRNVYIGNIDESWTEDRLRQDFSEFGETELVNMLREKSCAFVNFTNIANAIKAIEAMKGKEDYARFKVNFGKDRCGNAPRQVNLTHHDQYQSSGAPGAQDGLISQVDNGMGPLRRDSQMTNGVSPVRSGNQRQNRPQAQGAALQSLYTGVNNPSFAMYLNQASSQTGQQQYLPAQTQQPQMSGMNGINNVNGAYYGGNPNFATAGLYMQNNDVEIQQPDYQQYASHGPRNSITATAFSGAAAANGFLAPSNLGAAARASHSRAISLPAFSRLPSQHQSQQRSLKNSGFSGMGSGLGLGAGLNGFGLAIHGDSQLSRWAEEDVMA